METTIISHFFYFEVVYLAEKTIFFDETFFINRIENKLHRFR